MTYSIAARCLRTGMFGVAATTSNIGVGSRCLFAKAHIGAVLSQHRTDPRLGPRGIELLSQGKTAQEVVDRLVSNDPTIRHRQIAVVDHRGGTAYFHGNKIASVHGHYQGDQVIAIGNILCSPDLPKAMVKAFEEYPESPLADRLLRGLEAGEAFGSELRMGEKRQVKSAAMLVVHKESFPLVDLRVDFDRDPIRQLRFIWEAYQPDVQQYVTRALDPDHEPPP
jgi:uncharacterized Ntn-hydrolase superfamily protein